MNTLQVVILALLAMMVSSHDWRRHWRTENIDNVEKLGQGVLNGPESLAFKDGHVYTGVADGSIRKMNLATGEVSLFGYSVPNLSDEDRAKCGTAVTFEPLCGRPLGLQFDKYGNLYVGDAYKGLLRFPVGNPENVEVLATAAEDGIPFKMANDVAVTADGKTVYFTDSTRVYPRYLFTRIALDNAPDGRLLEYDVETGTVKTLLDGLRFANGVDFDKDGRSLLINECSDRRVKRYWIKGWKTGTTEVFVDDINGYPDNIHQENGYFYLGLFTNKSDIITTAQNNPKFRELIYQYIPDMAVIGSLDMVGLVHVYDSYGRLVKIYIDETGTKVGPIAEGYPYNGKLYLGSVVNNYLARVDL